METGAKVLKEAARSRRLCPLPTRAGGLQQQEDQGHIALYYFAAAGFALAPTIPYAWQEPKSVIELPAFRAGRINV
jgi:hypothetical protein